jgi:DNA mismatch repair ATPase MutS
MNNINCIIDRQSEIKFIIQNIEILSNIQLSDSIIFNCKDYLNSNIVPIKSSNKLSAISNSFGYRKYIPTLTKGIASFLQLRSQITYVLRINPPDAQQTLKDILNSIPEFDEKIRKTGIELPQSDKELTDVNVLIIDSLLRGNLLNYCNKLIAAFTTLDAYIALAKLNIDFNLNFPVFNDDRSPTVIVENLRHLAINDCKSNSFAFGSYFNLMYLTGPNMSGKSSFLKAFGSAVFLAHIGMGVPATSMNLSHFDGIISDINNEDRIAEGQSYFLSEVHRVKAISEKVVSSRKYFVICDELFRGTNVIDATDCTRVIVEGFASRKNSIFLIASHIHDIKSNLHKDLLIGWYYFESTLDNGKPIFTYLLKEGLSDQRYGLLILKNEGVCELLKRSH